MYHRSRSRPAGIIAGLAALALAASLAPASADHDDLPAPGDKLYAVDGGTIDVTIFPPTASYTNELYARVNGERQFVADNKSGVGSTTSIGPFEQDAEIIFEIDVFPQGAEDSIATYATGPGERNPDGTEHAVAIECGTAGDPELEPEPCATNNGKLYVGFEDLSANHPEYDHDFDDHVFIFGGGLTRRAPTTLVAHPSIVDLNFSPAGDVYLQVSATLTLTDGGAPVANEEITFHPTGPANLTGDPLCSATTDSTGLASCGFLLDNPTVVLDTVLGIGQYLATYAGSLNLQEAEDIGPIVAIMGNELLGT